MWAARCLHSPRLARPQWLLCRQLQRYQSATSSSAPTISPALLTRARSLAAEHAHLTTRLATEYDAPLAKKAGSLSTIASILKQWEEARKALPELHALLSDPSTDSTLRPIAETELSETHALLNTLSTQLKTSLIPPHPFAHLPCLLELRPGAGGDEAAVFAGDLLRMYISYCKRHGIGHSVLSLSSASAHGGEDRISEAVVEISDTGSYGRLKCEAGVHRVQRVPITETKGRTHTSAVGVMVLPNIAGSSGGEQGEEDFENPDSDYYVSPRDVRTDTFRASGAGGQHVNMTDSAVRLTHVPTGVVVSMQTSRSQHQNRERAWRLLRARIAQRKREEREEEVARVRMASSGGKGGKGGLGRGDKVRTYNWAQSRVTDHRCGFTSNRLGEVMDGGEALDGVMEKVREWSLEREVEGLVDDEDHKKSK